MPIFAFTDIEGSTGLWEKHQEAMGPVIAWHYTVLNELVAGHGGSIIKKTGDGIFALFPDEAGDGPGGALDCALELQRRFQAAIWPAIGELRVRMAFHRGYAEEMAGDYYGPTANRTARLMSLGWGGQILVSEDLRKQALLPEGAQWRDLGVHQVKDLPEPQHVFALTHPSLKLSEFPALKSLSNRPHNLPEQLSPFVGRTRELKDVATLLVDPQNRLITLRGGGGMGKSRLALQVARGNLDAFKHGVNLVGLEALSSQGELAARVADALKLGLYRERDAKEQVLEYLKDKHLLLILDPCEGLAGGAGLVSELLEACPNLRVLACSRRRLGLSGETVLDVRGLDWPVQATAEGFESSGCARLFTQHVAGLQPGFTLKTEDRLFFLKLCRLLQGMPLGLELAAGWTQLLPLKTLAERLEKDPHFLSSSRQDLPEHHRSLKGLFESAWANLNDREKEALAELSAFQGGFTPEAVQAVCRTLPQTLAGLADQCLLEVDESGRYTLAGGTRHFAADKLKENLPRRGEVLDLHARYFCRFVHERERKLLGYDQVPALTEIRREFPNVQSAWDWAVERGWAREIGQAARCLGLYTDMQGLAGDWEGRMARALLLWEGPLARTLEGLPREESQSAQASLLSAQANYLFSLGRGVEAREKMGASLALFKAANNRSGAAYALVRIAIFLGPEDERRGPALEEAASLYHSLEDANGAAWARRNLGFQLCRQGRAKEGKPMVEESLAIFRKVGNQRETAWSLNSLAQVALDSGQADAGMQGLIEARDLFLGLGDFENAGWTLNTMGRAAIKREQWAQARASLEESLRLFGQIRHFRGRSQALRSLCEIFARLGNMNTAYLVVDKAIAEAQNAGDWDGQAGALMQKGQLLVGQLKFDDALTAMKEGQAAFAKAGSETGQAVALESQACARLRQGQTGLARGLFELACQIFAQGGIHEGEARLCVRLGDLDAAEAKPKGGEDWYQRAVQLSRLNKPGDYSIGALLGLASLFLKQARKLESLHLALVCERALSEGFLPASEAEFYAELGRKLEAVLTQVGSKLMRSVIDDARAKLVQENTRTLLKECIGKYWS